MTLHNLPGRDALKAQAKRLRNTLKDQGVAITHATALETIAAQWGYRDWNTLSAAARSGPAWQVGQAVTGRYLGQAFTARLKSVQAVTGGKWRLTLRFDQPVDVVRSEWFSSLRRQVSATVNALGVTPEKTSDGQPHLTLRAA